MTILLTGGAGYIGSHTAVELMQSGYDVVIADDLSNSCAEVVRRIEELGGRGVRFYQIDVCDEAALERVFSENTIDSVIHFAGKKAVGESVKLPVLYYKNNLNATLSLIEVMNRFSVTSLVFSSSATVYGVPESVPISEDAPTWCTNPYGWTKLMSEQIFRDACVANPRLSVMLLRYFNPIGAHSSGRIGEDPLGIPNNLMPYISQVAIGRLERLSVYGNDYNTHDGTGVRDYIHVCDLARGHVAAVEYTRSHTGCETVNLGTGIGYSVLDVVHAFERSSGITIPYVIAPRRSGDVDASYANPEKAGALLGWKARCSIDDMCRDTWRWQRMNPLGYRSAD